jgi:hypothetical protein
LREVECLCVLGDQEIAPRPCHPEFQQCVSDRSDPADCAAVEGRRRQEVIVLGPTPYWQPALYKIIIKDYWYFTPKRISGRQNPAIESVAGQFNSSVTPNEDFRYVDLCDFFCNAEGCLTYLGDDPKLGLISFDESHLRPLGPLYLAKKLLAPLIVQEISK